MTLGDSGTPRLGASLIGSSSATDDSTAQDDNDVELLNELYRRLAHLQPTIPDRVSTILLESAGVRLNPGEGDARLARLVSLAGEKFITDILSDTMLHWKLSNGQNTGLLANPDTVKPAPVSGGNPLAPLGDAKSKQAAGTSASNTGKVDKRVSLTMENLLAALRDRDIQVTLALSCVVSAGVIAYVHIEQALERERVSATVREEIEATKALIKDRIEPELGKLHVLNLRIPFPNKPAAEVAYRTLAVDEEPLRSTTKVFLSVDDNVLCVKFTADISSEPKMDALSQMKKLRISINHWLDSLSLICETMAEFGDPSSDMSEPSCAITGRVTE
ncbi:hypothetical protein Aperf_G00000015540 [Anoplocephala perfoliata]